MFSSLDLSAAHHGDRLGQQFPLGLFHHALLKNFRRIALFDGHEWVTPRKPLLVGTRRAALLDQGVLQQADLSVADLRAAQKVRLFNAMIDFGSCEVETKHVHY